MLQLLPQEMETLVDSLNYKATFLSSVKSTNTISLSVVPSVFVFKISFLSLSKCFRPLSFTSLLFSCLVSELFPTSTLFSSHLVSSWFFVTVSFSFPFLRNTNLHLFCYQERLIALLKRFTS